MSFLNSVKMVTKASGKNSIVNNCLYGFLIRIVLTIYGVIHDKYFRLPYTDVDYKVYTLAAREVISQHSPYDYQPFRYSPLIAYLSTPNVLLFPQFGKVLASIFDVLIAYLIYKIVYLTYKHENKAVQCAQLWLYNPLPIIICTRGNMDSFSSALVLLTLYCQLKQNYLASGALLGLCTHLRLYPIVYALPCVLTAGRFTPADTVKRTYKAKLKVASTFVATVAAITGLFYYVYGQKFIQSSVWYHVTRQDIRHNFSLYFYAQYLDPFLPDLVKNYLSATTLRYLKITLPLVPVVCLQIVFSRRFNSLNHLPFSLFCSSFAFVAFNKVLTSQYFIWFLALLPLFLPSIILSKKKVVTIVSSWCGAQALWLLAAYLLEFRGYDTFAYIHVASLLFFAVNVWIVTTFVKHYNDQVVKKID